jgi:hypothetical protein
MFWLLLFLDGLVCVHDLTVFAPITTLERARGATMFVLDLQVSGLVAFSNFALDSVCTQMFDF